MRRVISDINLTNLIDVTMVALICYMLLTPLTEHGIDVALPQTAPHQIEQKQEPITITIAKNGTIYLGNIQITLSELTKHLQIRIKQKPDTGVIIRADKDVNYGKVIHVLDELNNSGITKVGMATETKV